METSGVLMVAVAAGAAITFMFLKGRGVRRSRDVGVQTASFSNTVMNEVTKREEFVHWRTVDSLKGICSRLGINAGSGPAKQVLVRAVAGSFSYDPCTDRIDTAV